MVNNVLVALLTGGYIAFYLILRAVWRYKKYGKIFGVHREEKRMEKEFNAEMEEQSYRRIMAEALEKRFQKINRKNRKKVEKKPVALCKGE